eukprot:COSAG06_NODE_4123_length_4548_cov_6.030569_5_plen_125_part_00
MALTRTPLPATAVVPPNRSESRPHQRDSFAATKSSASGSCSVCLHVARCRNRDQWEGWMETLVSGGASTYRCVPASIDAFAECQRVAGLSATELRTDVPSQERRQRYGSALLDCLDQYSREKRE